MKKCGFDHLTCLCFKRFLKVLNDVSAVFKWKHKCVFEKNCWMFSMPCLALCTREHAGAQYNVGLNLCLKLSKKGNSASFRRDITQQFKFHFKLPWTMGKVYGTNYSLFHSRKRKLCQEKCLEVTDQWVFASGIFSLYFRLVSWCSLSHLAKRFGIIWINFLDKHTWNALRATESKNEYLSCNMRLI